MLTPPSVTTTVTQAPVTTPEKPVVTTPSVTTTAAPSPVTTTAAPVTTAEKPTTSSSSAPITTSERATTSSSSAGSSPITTASPAESTTSLSSAGVTTSPSESEHSGHSTDPSDTTNGERPEGSRVPVPDGEKDTEGPVTDVLPVVPKPPVIEARQQDVQAALHAPPVVVDVVNPPPPPPTAPRVDIYQQVNTVIQNNTNVVVNNTVVANSLEVTYNDYHQPTFINPYREDFRVRYFYSGSYHEIWVPIGGRIVIPVPVIGIYPFTAVSANHVWAGDFCGGSYMAPVGWVGPPPPTWRPPPPPVV